MTMIELRPLEVALVIRIIALAFSVALLLRMIAAFHRQRTSEGMWNIVAMLTLILALGALALAAVGGLMPSNAIEIRWLNTALSAAALGGTMTLAASWHPAKLCGED